jgi:hypothetical protein
MLHDMSRTLQSTVGLRVVENDWPELVESLTQLAEGYAVTDRPNGYLYWSEARDFALLPCPASEEELVLREAEAETLKRRWGERLRQSNRP